LPVHPEEIFQRFGTFQRTGNLWQSKDGQGARVALLQSPILPAVPQSKSKITTLENPKKIACVDKPHTCNSCPAWGD
jgi:hypothetical protein